MEEPYALFMLHPDGLSKSKNKKFCENALLSLKNLNLIIFVFILAQISGMKELLMN